MWRLGYKAHGVLRRDVGAVCRVLIVGDQAEILTVLERVGP